MIPTYSVLPSTKHLLLLLLSRSILDGYTVDVVVYRKCRWLR